MKLAKTEFKKDVVSIQNASPHAHYSSLAHVNRHIKKALLVRKLSREVSQYIALLRKNCWAMSLEQMEVRMPSVD